MRIKGAITARAVRLGEAIECISRDSDADCKSILDILVEGEVISHADGAAVEEYFSCEDDV